MAALFVSDLSLAIPSTCPQLSGNPLQTCLHCPIHSYTAVLLLKRERVKRDVQLKCQSLRLFAIVNVIKVLLFPCTCGVKEFSFKHQLGSRVVEHVIFAF